VLGHSAFPHHHHSIEIKIEKHGHHDHDDSHNQDQDSDHEQDHNAFTFSQIDHIFLNGKQLDLPIVLAITPVTISPIFTREDYKEEYFDKDIQCPPLIDIPSHSLRGPPYV
jgi:hypothetical protein